MKFFTLYDVIYSFFAVNTRCYEAGIITIRAQYTFCFKERKKWEYKEEEEESKIKAQSVYINSTFCVEYIVNF